MSNYGQLKEFANEVNSELKDKWPKDKTTGLTMDEVGMMIQASNVMGGPAIAAVRLGAAAKYAQNTATEVYPTGPKDDGHRDALRHILATIHVMKATDNNLSPFASPEIGYELMQAREKFRGNTMAPMDMWNNKIGRDIYMANPNATDKEFLEAAKAAVQGGRAVVHHEGHFVFSNHAPAPPRRADVPGEMPFADRDGVPVVRTASVASDFGPKNEQMFEHIRGKIEGLGVVGDNQKLDKLALDLTVQSMDKKLTGTPEVTASGSTLWAIGAGPDGNRAKIDMDITQQKDVGQIQQEGRQVVAANAQATTVATESQELKPRGLAAA
jgi:hypothetical protein